MAEYAQLRFEEWDTILAEIQRLQLLQSEEMSELKKDILQFEYVVQKMTRSLDDVLNYVDYQVKLLDMLNGRRLDIQLIEKWKEIEQKILHRINSLFGVYERLFCKDLQYWEARIDFNLKQKWFEGVSKVFGSAIINLGSDHPHLYEKAASYEWKLSPLKNIESARTILNGPLRLNRRDLDLYIWRYELELKHADFLVSKADRIDGNTSKKTEYESEATKCLGVAELLYKDAINFCPLKNNCVVRLYTRFIETVLKYPRFESQMEPILKDLDLNCRNLEESYEALCQLRFAKGHVAAAVSELEKGLELVKTVKMYDIAIKILRLFVANQKLPVNAAFAKLKDILVQGQSQDLLSEDSYLIWINLFQTYSMRLQNGIPNGTRYNDGVFDETDKVNVINAALARYPSSFQLSVELLKNHMNTPTAAIQQTIAKMQSQIPDETEDTMLDNILLVLGCDAKHMPPLLNTYINSSPKRAARYLSYINLNDGIAQARKIHQKMSHRDSCSVLKTMAAIEFRSLNQSASNEAKFKGYRELMEKACILHGRNDIDVWITFIGFEKNLGNEKDVSEIYARALNSVNTTLKEKLMHSYQEFLRKKTNNNYL